MSSNAIVLNVEETKLKDLIEQIVNDTIQEVAGGTFIGTNEVTVSKEKLAVIMGYAAIRAYEVGQTGVYTIPKLEQVIFN